MSKRARARGGFTPSGGVVTPRGGRRRSTPPEQKKTVLLGPRSSAVRSFATVLDRGFALQNLAKTHQNCAWCAIRWQLTRMRPGTYKMRYPCRDCPEGVKQEASYKDETGASNKLCADHARIAGTHEVFNPCRDCPEGAKRQAFYKDETGTSSKLCADHARIAGTHEVRNPCRDCQEGLTTTGFHLDTRSMKLLG